jgi:hypothetical protein
VLGQPRDLKDIVDFTGFDFDNYRVDEKRILQPQIEALGYENVQWYEEVGSDGEPRRMARAIGGITHSLIAGEGKTFYFYTVTQMAAGNQARQ